MDIQINRSCSPALPPSIADDSISDGTRVRACETCRLSKVRCEKPNPEEPCTRCAKAWRACLPASRNRSHRKQSAYHRQLTVLEDHVRRLVNTLGVDLPWGGGTEAVQGVDKNSEQGPSGWDQIKLLNFKNPPDDADGVSRRLSVRPTGSLTVSSGTQSLHGLGREDANSCVVLIDRTLPGILNFDQAERRFHHYCSQLAPTFPAVIFQPTATAQDVRSSTPILFLATITVARTQEVETQHQLDDLLSKVIEHSYLRRSTYSLELVQAVVIATLWHAPNCSPEREGMMNLQQLGHVVAKIAGLIGLGCSNSLDLNRNSWPALTARRTWLACYHICINNAMRTAENNPIRWGHRMEECLEVLENSPLALTSDVTLCRYTRLQQIAAEYCQLLRTSLQGSQPLINLTGTLQRYQEQIGRLHKHWNSQHDMSAVEKIHYHAAKLSVYEAAVENDCRLSGILDNRTASTKPPCLASQPNAVLSAYVDSARAVLSEFISLPQHILQVLPTIVHLRVMHATVILVKSTIYLSQNCQAGWCFAVRMSELHTDKSLDDLIKLLASCSADWPSRQWIQAILKLRARLRQREEQSTRKRNQKSGSSRTLTMCPSSSSANTNMMHPFTPTPTTNLAELPSPLPHPGRTYLSPLNTADVPDLVQKDTSKFARPMSTREAEIAGNGHSPGPLEELFLLDSPNLEGSTGLFSPGPVYNTGVDMSLFGGLNGAQSNS